MSGGYQEIRLNIFPTMVCAGLGGSVAQAITIPLDTMKIRMMLHSSTYKNSFDCFKKLISQSPTQMWTGLVSGIHRQLIFCSLRVGIFYSINDWFQKRNQNTHTNYFQKVGVGLLAGGFSTAFSNPVQVVKIRIQGDSKLVRKNPRYSSTMKAYKMIYLEQGIKSFWIGLGPNLVRNSVINSVLLSSYAQIKQFLLGKRIMKDNSMCHFVSAFVSGVFATIVVNPVDMLKNKVIHAKNEQERSLRSCIRETWRLEGLRGFYLGVFPHMFRVGLFNICMFVSFEKFKWIYLHKLE